MTTETNGLILANKIIVYIYPVVAVIGVITNLLALITFSRKKFQNTVFSTYFRFLTIFDTLIIAILLNKFVENNFNIFFRDFSNDLCKFRFFMFYTIYPISGWTLVVISIDRFINISFTNSRFLFAKKIKFQLIVCLIVMMFNSILSMPNLFYYLKPSNLTTNQTSIITYKCTNPGFSIEWLDMTVSTLLPFIFMLLFTLLTIHFLFKSRKNLSKNKQKDVKFALTSIALCLIFFILNLPRAMLQLGNMYDKNFVPNKDLYQTLTSLFFLISYINSSTVFFINMIVNKMFRDEFTTLVCSLLNIRKKTILNNHQSESVNAGGTVVNRVKPSFK